MSEECLLGNLGRNSFSSGRGQKSVCREGEEVVRGKEAEVETGVRH